jgi:predicted nucleotidyltransferase
MMLNPNDPNVAMLELVSQRLSAELRLRLVFTGGAVVGLLVTDPAMPSIRPTEDVDLMVQVLARAEFHEVEASLRSLGFVPDMSPAAPICRWRIDQITVDVMPTLETILGFSNRWYPLAVQTAQTLTLPSGQDILVVQAPVFIATKIEAFHGRGQGDHLFSHDLGDVITLVDGREELLDECLKAPQELRRYLSEQMALLLQQRSFIDALPGHLPADAASQSRLPEVLRKLRALGQMA